MKPIDGYPGDQHPAALGDVFAKVCPHAAYPQSQSARQRNRSGHPADSLLRLMLRRGIPFGEPIAGVADPSDELKRAERGLMFLAYMSSIEDQFELVTRRWTNSAVQPNLGGHDPVIGQRDTRGNRARSIQVRRGGGILADIPLPADWVRPTRGGYFFTPISALTRFGG